MQRDQNDTPSISEIISLTALREQAKKLKINLGAAGRSKAMTVAEIKEQKRASKAEAQRKTAAENEDELQKAGSHQYAAVRNY